MSKISLTALLSTGDKICKDFQATSEVSSELFVSLVSLFVGEGGDILKTGSLVAPGSTLE